MLEADKAALSATVQQGVLAIRSQELQLYLSDLTAVSMQGSLLAGFAITLLSCNTIPPGSPPAATYNFFIWGTVSFSMSLYTACHATYVIMRGPSLALRGGSAEVMIFAVETMKEERRIIFQCGLGSVISFFMCVAAYCWIVLITGQASMVTVILGVGAIVICAVAVRVHRTFQAMLFTKDKHLGIKVSYSGKSLVSPSELSNQGTKTVTRNEADVKSSRSYQAQADGAKVETGIVTGSPKRTSLKADGAKSTSVQPSESPPTLALEVLKKAPMDRGGVYEGRFMVVENGRVYFFASKKDFLDHNNPTNPDPIFLSDYTLTLDIRPYDSTGFTFSRLFSAGQHQQQFRFGLLPLQSQTELVLRERILLEALTDKDYRTCLDVLRRYASSGKARARSHIDELLKMNHGQPV